tara:strand:- start:42 stop:236 length:195 start_codon:yes stop_codon:yes gene_type:complete
MLIFILISGCSVDTKTGIWKNIDQTDDKKKELPNNSLDESLTFNKYKEKIILYGEKSTFPSLDD